MSEVNPHPEAVIANQAEAHAPTVALKPQPVYREPPVLTLPDWKGASASHWLTQWEQQHGLRRVVQHDWLRPLRGDWMMQLQETVLKFEQCHVLAHGLGAHLIDAWLQHTQQARRVLSVTLIDPVDLQDPDWSESLFTWKPLPRLRWRVPTTVLWKERSVTPGVGALLEAWGATPADAGQPLGAGVVAGWALLEPHWQAQEQHAAQRAAAAQLSEQTLAAGGLEPQVPSAPPTQAPDADQG